jgi:hypothetical protein
MAVPAEPMLASALWASHHSRSDELSTSASQPPGSGCLAIDTTFEGALQYGRVCCISAEAGSCGRELCLAYLVSHLLRSATATATIIDTSLSFDVRKLYKLLLVRLKGEAEANERAMEALDRLKIMKVFDFEGLTDSIVELRDSLEGIPSNPDPQAKLTPPPRGTIGDSEDEDEMLDSPSPPADLQGPISKKNPAHEVLASNLLLIDSISHVAGPMMRNRYVEGQALLVSFMRSLNHLTTRHQLLTLLLNDATAKTNIKDDSPSIFSTCKIMPALGRSFEHILDTHLLIHRASAKVASNQPGHQAGGESGERLVSVAEMLRDRHSGAYGRWAAFTTDEGGVLKAYK